MTLLRRRGLILPASGLAKDNHLRELDPTFSAGLAHCVAEVNAAHPFREGNGRALRAFFGQLAEEAGFRLAWEQLDPARNMDVSRAAHRGDGEPLRVVLVELTEPNS